MVMQFSAVVLLLHDLENTRSRNVMTEAVASFLMSVDVREIREICYLILGQLGPLFARTDFGMAEKMVMRAIARSADQPAEEVMKLNKQLGDLGETTEQVFRAQLACAGKGTGDRKQKLTAMEVYEQLLGIAKASGEGSQEQKVELLTQLFGYISPQEARYVVRIVLGKMRLGFSDKTILDALAVMDGGSKAGRDRLEIAYQSSPDIGAIAALVKQWGLMQAAEQVKATLGVPVMPALAQRLKSPGEMIAKMGKVVVDPKYDGTRTQIHYGQVLGDSPPDGEAGGQGIAKTFARSLEDTSAMFPELETISKQITAESVIIDCEAVGYNPQTGALLPFQDTITRKRKHGVEALSKTLPIKFFCFDLLFLNGESLLNKPLYERRQLLQQVIEAGDVLEIAPMMVTDSVEELRAYHKLQLGAGLEGAMVKKYDGEYQPGRTGWNWVKFKAVEESEGKLADTVDGVVMGYYRGKGKRSAFGIGAFLLGILDEKTNKYVTVAKIGTGLTDDQWREMKRRVDSSFSIEPPITYLVPDGLKPDVWADPQVVVEVAADEITKSPLHSSGWGLRFPRLVRFRDDKTVVQITNTLELVEIRG